MNTPKLFQFPNTVTVDLNQIQVVGHVYFRLKWQRVTDGKAFFLKLTFIRGGEVEFYLGEIEEDAEKTQRQVIDRWAQDK